MLYESHCVACQRTLGLVAPILIQVESLRASTHPWESNHTLRKVTVRRLQRDPRCQEFLWIKSIFKPASPHKGIFEGFHPRIASFSEQKLFILESVAVMCDWDSNFSQSSTSWDDISPHSSSSHVCTCRVFREQQVVQCEEQCQEGDEHLLLRRHCINLSNVLSRAAGTVPGSIFVAVWLRWSKATSTQWLLFSCRFPVMYSFLTVDIIFLFLMTS